MAVEPTRWTRKIWQTLSSIKTGVVLLITVVVLSAVGTIVLQRPVTEADEMQRAYSPEMLRFLDALGLTDVFHAWWFVTLMLLVSVSIVAASIERFPNAWRYFARPYKYPDKNFRRALAIQKQILIPDEETGLVAAERALHHIGFKAERVVQSDHFALFAERNRFSEMAVYVVHASLLLIFFGGIVDALWGWRGFVTLTKGAQASVVELRDGTKKFLPFAVRCDGAGQENYADGTPKKWWSQLAVVKNGKDLQAKQIVVNDPLVYHGVRFYQSSYGPTGNIDKLLISAQAANGLSEKKELALGVDETASLDPDTTVKLAEFFPDYVIEDGRVYNRSTSVENPAAHFIVSLRTTGKSVNFWLPPLEGLAENAQSPYVFEALDLKVGYFTGLEVSHEPGQWAVWTGVVLMGFGLTMVFYVAHTRLWAVPVREANGKLVLWIGGTANRNREALEQRFVLLAEKVEAELKSTKETPTADQVASIA
ncbi:MAG TPA: cytochrome c biogenesis protein ResB [Terriglobales bacterium]|nr:cytochrome c biogenesis protein ResB [Terriglobales bacterium]